MCHKLRTLLREKASMVPSHSSRQVLVLTQGNRDPWPRVKVPLLWQGLLVGLDLGVDKDRRREELWGE